MVLRPRRKTTVRHVPARNGRSNRRAADKREKCPGEFRTGIMVSMERKEITKFLGELLIAQRFSGMGKYWASEVSIDPWSVGGKRVDFMQFVPQSQTSISSIEKGIFICYEVKSCIEDVYSGNGLNFFGEKNYIVTTMQCYKKLTDDMRTGKFIKHMDEFFPESSTHFGIIVPVPVLTDWEDEFLEPSEITREKKWELKAVKNCYPGERRRSITELLFCMLRSGK